MCRIHIRQDRVQSDMEINFRHPKCWIKQHPMGVTFLISHESYGLLHETHQGMASMDNVGQTIFGDNFEK